MGSGFGKGPDGKGKDLSSLNTERVAAADGRGGGDAKGPHAGPENVIKRHERSSAGPENVIERHERSSRWAGNRHKTS